MTKPNNTLLLFDVDGTLTIPRNPASKEMKDALLQCRQKGYKVAIVGGSDLSKQYEQLGNNCLNEFDFVFCENGLQSFKEGKEFFCQSLVKHLGNDKIKLFVKFCLRMIADLDIPIQRGTFIEFRNGMINISPIGRNCSQHERDEFDAYDKVHHIREGMIEKLRKEFPGYDLHYSIGGQISFDVFPVGWDKTYCLQFVKDDFKEIHFFGDKTSKGGNDYEIYTSPLVKGHSVKTFNDTINILQEEFIGKT